MSVSHGMNIAEIEAFGNRLQQHFSTQLNSIADELETVVGQTSSSWVGPDGEKFRSWWPAKRSAIRATADDVHGFGQSALNNASQQREASGDRAASSGTGSGPWVGIPTPVPGTPDLRVDGEVWKTGELTDDPGALEKEFVSEYTPARGKFDQYNMYYNPDGNCTSYVAWRLNDIAEQRGLDWSMSNNHIGDQSGLRLGDAHKWGESAGAAGYAPDGNAQAGSVAYWGLEDGKGDYGHVGIVRSVGADGTITVEESAWGSSVFSVKTYKPGDAGYPGGFIHMLPDS